MQQILGNAGHGQSPCFLRLTYLWELHKVAFLSGDGDARDQVSGLNFMFTLGIFCLYYDFQTVAPDHEYFVLLLLKDLHLLSMPPPAKLPINLLCAAKGDRNRHTYT